MSPKNKLSAVEWLPYIALVLVALIYGANYTIAKEVMPRFVQPYGLIVLRVGGALICFWTVQVVWVKERVALRDLPYLAVCGVVGAAFNMLAFFKGLNWTTPVNAALIMLTVPVLVLLISAFVEKEKLSTQKIAGMLLGIGGAALLITNSRAAAIAANGWKGDLLVFANACLYAVYLILIKRLIGRYQPNTVITWVFSFGFLIVLPIGAGELAAVKWQEMPLPIWVAVFYVVVAVTFLTYSFNGFALKHISPTVVSSFVYLQPLFATLVALGFGKDQLSVAKLFASALIFGGVYLISRPPLAISENTEKG